MSKWKIVKLGDVVDVVSGSTPKTSVKEYWDGEYDWVTPAELDDNISVIYETQRKITKKAVIDTNLKLLPPGTVLLTSRAPIGKVAIAGKNMYCNQGFKNLICSKSIYNKYVFWFLKGKTEYLNSLGRGATFKELSKSIVENINIPLPPLTIQKQIATTLDTASEIIKLRKKQFDELNNLIKSVFYNMFGDPVTNEKGWKVKKLKEVTKKIGSGATPRGGKENYKKEGISLIRSMNVYDGQFIYDDLAFIDEDQAKQLNNVIVEADDVLINITGASVARSCIVPIDVLPARVNQHVSIIRPIKNIVDKFYLNNLFIYDTFKQNLLIIASAGGATREAITKNQLEELIIPVPPLCQQKKFAEIVTKIEEQKALVQKAIDESQYLFDSLMSKYFDQQ